jgi:uncharacterized membrane protein YbaN (DUF454 family)
MREAMSGALDQSTHDSQPADAAAAAAAAQAAPSTKPAETAFRRVRRVLFAGLGFIFFGLGAVGAFLPILPTTPFLLLAAACFSRSSKRFDDWMKGTKLYKKHLASFVENRSMTLKTKVTLCAFASTMLIIAFIVAPVIYARVLIVAVLLFKYYYFIFRIKTIPSEKAAAKPPARAECPYAELEGVE